jgi:hypothetical protein
MAGKPIGPPFPCPRVLGCAFHPGGKRLAISSADNRVRVWLLPEPVAGARADVIRLVEVLTGKAVEEGAFRALDEKALAERRRKLQSSGVRWPRRVAR